MSKIIALNSKHQSVVNKAISWLEKYNTANDQRDLAQREVNQIEKSEIY